jgi:hypothetical protein
MDDSNVCEICKERNAIGWRYFRKYGPDRPEKKTYMCLECLPVRRSPRMLEAYIKSNGYCYIV